MFIIGLRQIGFSIDILSEEGFRGPRGGDDPRAGKPFSDISSPTVPSEMPLSRSQTIYRMKSNSRQRIRVCGPASRGARRSQEMTSQASVDDESDLDADRGQTGEEVP
jgi:hypothetical protein